jgi:hypothetical protein
MGEGSLIRLSGEQLSNPFAFLRKYLKILPGHGSPLAQTWVKFPSEGDICMVAAESGAESLTQLPLRRPIHCSDEVTWRW